MTFKKISVTILLVCLILCGCGDYNSYTKTVKVTFVTDNAPSIVCESSVITDKIEYITTVSEDISIPKDKKIYRTKTGKSYHYDNPCGSGDYFECTLEEAIADGLNPCKKCVDD